MNNKQLVLLIHFPTVVHAVYTVVHAACYEDFSRSAATPGTPEWNQAGPWVLQCKLACCCCWGIGKEEASGWHVQLLNSTKAIYYIAHV